MRRGILLVFALLLTSAAGSGAAKPVRKPPPPPPKPKVPTTIIDETAGATTSSPPEPKKKKQKAPRLELAVCAVADLAELDSKGLLKLIKKCTSLKGRESATPLSEDEMLVAVCVHKGEDGDEAVEAKECGLTAAVTVAGSSPLSLGADGDLALALRASKIIKETKPGNGTTAELSATQTPDEGEPKTTTAQLVFRSGGEGYGGGRFVWFPLPMLTTDFSSSSKGYRLGITPVAVGAGWKFFPSSSSRGYFGTSAFVAWNLLVPNDTQTLSNGTFVRINYKAFGAGVLLDASGYFAVGLGVGHTFTTDSRTDFRMWFYFGPKLLLGLNEF